MNLFLAVAMVVQGGTPEEAFKRIGETLEKARTVRLKFKLEVVLPKDGDDTKWTVSGAILFKEGNKVKLKYEGAAGDGLIRDNWVVSDGTKVRIKKENAFTDSAQWDTPRTLISELSVWLLRYGVLDIYGVPYRLEYRGLDPKEMLKVSAFKFGEKGQEGSTLAFNLQSGTDGTVAEINLWYDPKTFVPLKRTLVIPIPGAIPQKGRVTETYEECLLNADLPDETFRFPKE
jgi:outer membrane lipoprotein-sorting protein